MDKMGNTKICEICKQEHLIQLNVKMRFSIGYVDVGTCEECGESNKHLYEFEQIE